MDKNIFGGKNTLDNANEDRSNLLIEIMNFKENAKSKDLNRKTKKRYSLKFIFNFRKYRNCSLWF